MLRTYRERLSLVLLALLPFHALLVTVLTKVIAGPNHAPLAWLVLWKEALLGLILLIAFVEIIQAKRSKKFDALDWCVLFLIALSVVVTAFTHHDLGLFAVGFKYDFVPLVVFIILKRVEWSGAFVERTLKITLIDGIILSLYGLLAYFLPASFFATLGYSDLHSLYIPDRPIAAFQYIEGAGLRRMQSAMSGPNQLGIWMLLPYAVALLHMPKRKKEMTHLLTFALILLAIFFTFSRSVWIAALLIGAVFFFDYSSFRYSWKWMSGLAAVVIIAATAAALAVPSVVQRLSSTANHFAYPLKAISTMADHPLGKGLGTAGPASSKRADACVFLQATDDPSWAEDQPNLCVFTGNKQVQPVDRDCNCPFLTENWYLQLGVELGFIGFFAYLLFIGLVIWKLTKVSDLAIYYAFLGVVIVGLFLHSFEDSAVAYSLWLLVAVALSRTDTTTLKKKIASFVNRLQ